MNLAARLMPSALRPHSQYVRAWWARLLATAAQQMVLVAVGWRMASLTGSAWDLGLVGLLQFLPSLALMFHAGHLVDRRHRARILAGCYAAQAVLALALAAMVALAPPVATERWGLLLFSILLGVVRAYQMPAQQALMPMLVPSDVLPQALAFSSSAVQGAIITGPAIGGFLYGVSASTVFAVSAGCFVIGTAAALRIRHAAARGGAPPNKAALLAGLRFVRGHKALFAAISLDLAAVLFGGATALLPLVAKDILHADANVLGVLRAAPAVGALVTGLALVRAPIVRHAGVKMLAGVAVFGLATIVFGLSTSLWLSLAALAVTGAADMVSMVVRQTLMQLETPDDMRGRVGAVTSVFIGASNQLGEFESGAAAALLGLTSAIVLGGILAVALALIWWRAFPELAQRDRLQ